MLVGLREERIEIMEIAREAIRHVCVMYAAMVMCMCILAYDLPLLMRMIAVGILFGINIFTCYGIYYLLAHKVKQFERNK